MLDIRFIEGHFVQPDEATHLSLLIREICDTIVMGVAVTCPIYFVYRKYPLLRTTVLLPTQM